MTYLELKNAANAVTINGGATRTSDIVVSNPSVAVNVGKKALKFVERKVNGESFMRFSDPVVGGSWGLHLYPGV